MEPRPQRTSGIEIKEVDDGFVIHEPGRDRLHYLNHTAVVVLELCTGAHTAARIAQLVQAAYALPAPPDAEVALVLDQLRDEGLIR